jgi:myo-inositol 2-dehydrogenase / D-chiro-inositol 1-dehydrogenase
VAVVDPDVRRRTGAANWSGASPFCDLHQALEGAEIDAVVIASPTACHAEQALLACRARKHVYVEKPLASDVPSGRSVVEAARASRVCSVVGYTRRLHPAAEQARAALRSGRIGKLRAVRSTFCEPVPGSGQPEWKRSRSTGGGVLLDLASHHVDLLRWLLGAEVSAARASADGEAAALEDVWVEWLFTGALRVQGWYSCRSGPVDALEFLGDDGILVVDRIQGRVTLQTRRRFRYGLARPRLLGRFRNIPSRARRLVHPAYDESYSRALSAFVSFAAGRPTADSQNLASAADGLSALEAVHLAEQSLCGS